MAQFSQVWDKLCEVGGATDADQPRGTTPEVFTSLLCEMGGATDADQPRGTTPEVQPRGTTPEVFTLWDGWSNWCWST